MTILWQKKKVKQNSKNFILPFLEKQATVEL